MRNDPGAVMLFAAGFGKRMGDMTLARPKPLLDVAGRPLLDHALALADEAGVPRKVVNAHYRAEMISEHLRGREVALSVEWPDILETGGGLRHALPLLGEGPVFTLNTDAIWTGPNPLVSLRSAWEPERMDALLLLVPRDRAIGHGGAGDFLMDDAGRLSRGPGHIFVGASITKPEGLAAFDEPSFSLLRLWERMAAEGRLSGALHPGGWCDVGSPAGLALAEDMLAAVQ
jgi:MurNAc alpha-1-phosphate uridylyltransferase